MTQNAEKLSFCFFCASVYEGERCPVCGGRISRDRYEALLGEARRAALYGWRYRRTYESELRQTGEVKTKYALADCGELIYFAAAAAVSGVIGGFSYDIIQKAVGRLARAAEERKRSREERAFLSWLEKEENLKEFMRYMDEFYNAFDQLEKKVRAAVCEEMIADAAASDLEKILPVVWADPKLKKEEKINLFERLTEESLRRAARLNEEKKPPLPENFSELWSALEKEKEPLDKEDAQSPEAQSIQDPKASNQNE